MKIVYMGTPNFAVGPLEALRKAGFEIAAAVTQPDKPKGRGKAVQMPPVKEKALEYGIPVYQPRRVKDSEFTAVLHSIAPDVIVVAAFGQLLSGEILRIPRYGCLNIHASLLPRYRGAAPIQWAVINGEEKTGVTIMQMDEGLDTGDMLLKEEVAIAPDETGGSLHDKLSALGADLIVQALNRLEKGELIPVPQTGESCYASMLEKSMGKIDWNRPAAEIERLIRGMDPWPSAYSRLQGKMIKIWKAVVEPDSCPDSYPGQICAVTKHDFSVKTGSGLLRVTCLQPEGKKRMDADAFLRGYPLTEGLCFKD